MKSAEASIESAADRQAVFDLWATEDGLCSWMAAEATLDVRPGGAWRWVHDNGAASSGRYVTVDPPDVLEFTYGWESGPITEVTPGSTTVKVTFEDVPAGTRVRVEHTGLTAALAERHLGGWNYFLPLLADAAVTGAVGGTRLPPEPDATTGGQT